MPWGFTLHEFLSIIIRRKFSPVKLRDFLATETINFHPWNGFSIRVIALKFITQEKFSQRDWQVDVAQLFKYFILRDFSKKFRSEIWLRPFFYHSSIESTSKFFDIEGFRKHLSCIKSFYMSCERSKASRFVSCNVLVSLNFDIPFAIKNWKSFLEKKYVLRTYFLKHLSKNEMKTNVKLWKRKSISFRFITWIQMYFQSFGLFFC